MKPLNRKEIYLARMAGEDVQMPEPLTREEAYMKGIASQIEAGSAELPAVTDADEGKILAVNANGKWDKADAPTELPAVTTDDNGDVLTVVGGAWAKAASKTPIEVYAAEGNTINWNESFIEDGVCHLHFSVTGTWTEAGIATYITSPDSGKTLPMHKDVSFGGAIFGAWAVKNSNGAYFMIPFYSSQNGLLLTVGMNSEMTASTYIIKADYPIAE